MLLLRIIQSTNLLKSKSCKMISSSLNLAVNKNNLRFSFLTFSTSTSNPMINLSAAGRRRFTVLGTLLLRNKFSEKTSVLCTNKFLRRFSTSILLKNEQKIGNLKVNPTVSSYYYSTDSKTTDSTIDIAKRRRKTMIGGLVFFCSCIFAIVFFIILNGQPRYDEQGHEVSRLNFRS